MKNNESINLVESYQTNKLLTFEFSILFVTFLDLSEITWHLKFSSLFFTISIPNLIALNLVGKNIAPSELNKKNNSSSIAGSFLIAGLFFAILGISFALIKIAFFLPIIFIIISYAIFMMSIQSLFPNTNCHRSLTKLFLISLTIYFFDIAAIVLNKNNKVTKIKNLTIDFICKTGNKEQGS